MSATLRPASDEERETLIPQIQAEYAEDMVENGGFDPEVARRKAEDDIPHVLSLPTQTLFIVEEDDEAVGHLWLAERDSPISGPTFFVYDVFVREEYRGRGLGRQAMLLAEGEARRRGLDTIALNVFGGNEVARALYRSLDYREDFVSMRKSLR